MRLSATWGEGTYKLTKTPCLAVDGFDSYKRDQHYLSPAVRIDDIDSQMREI